MRQNPVGTLIDMTPTLSGSEAVFAFAGWLTCRNEAVTLSAVHDAAVAADLVVKFNERQGLADPREGWDKGIKPMGKKKGGRC
jgi:hypothetical protein